MQIEFVRFDINLLPIHFLCFDVSIWFFSWSIKAYFNGTFNWVVVSYSPVVLILD